MKPHSHSPPSPSSSSPLAKLGENSSIASTFPPNHPSLGDNLIEDVDGEKSKDGDKNDNGDEHRGGVTRASGGAIFGSQWKPLQKGNAECWKHFEKGEIDGKVKAMCNYCRKLLLASTANGTKALNEHYKRCLKRKVADSSQKVLTQSIMTGGGKRKLEAYTFDQNFARRELACMVIIHEYPLSIVEHAGFKRFALALQPLFDMGTRNTLKADIFKIHDAEKSKALKSIEKTESRIAVTTDMWTSSNQKKGFMVITGHFVDDSWTLRSLILRFIYVPCPHTAEVLSEALMETLLDWNIDRKLSTLTVDNCSSNDSMLSILFGKLDSESLMFNGKLLHMRCAAHILNLIVKDGLEVIKGAIEKIRDSVSYWTATPKRDEKFVENSRQLHISCGKKLSLDCVTRWNSTFLMLQTALEYKDVFSRLKIRESQYKSCPEDSDWDVAKEVCHRLEGFYKATEVFSGTKYPTSNLFFAKVCKIKMSLDEWANAYEYNEMSDLYAQRNGEMMRKMASKMIEKYEKYWAKIHGILGVAVVLDPRFKMKLVEYYFDRIYGNDATFQIEKIHNYCKELLMEYEMKSNNGASNSSRHVEPTIEADDDDLSDFDLFVTNHQKSSKVLSKKTELDLYLEESVLPRSSQDFDVLYWWKNDMKFPTLRLIARDVLSIPISTVASESAFSTSGRVVTPHRSRLHPKTLETLMCARNWLMASEDGGDNANEFASVVDMDFE